jgi:two-component system response regulator BaeR
MMAPNHHILVVEDEKKIAELLKDYLKAASYDVSCLHEGRGVVSFVKERPPDLILLDIMLPGKDGMEICREIRKFSNVPIIMITAKVDELDRLIGLELGADDYICKPFSPREVVARVKAVFRRIHREPDSKKLKAGPISLDMDTRLVTVHGDTVKLTPSEFGLLQVMMAHPGRVYSRNELINKVQGYDFEGYDRTIDTHVKNLRKKISAKLPGQEIISTVYSVGYKFIPPEPH